MGQKKEGQSITNMCHSEKLPFTTPPMSKGPENWPPELVIFASTILKLHNPLRWEPFLRDPTFITHMIHTILRRPCVYPLTLPSVLVVLLESGAGGGQLPHSQNLADQLTLSQTVRLIMPTILLLDPQIFRPSYGHRLHLATAP